MGKIKRFRPNKSHGQQQKNNIADATQVMRQLPVPALLQCIEWQLGILKEKGIEVVDWDNKDKVLTQVRFVGGKAYYFAGDKDPGGNIEN